MPKKKALITGISGQDGAYLAKLLLEKNYNVVGGERQNANRNLWRLKKLQIEKEIKIIPFEMLEENNINKVVRDEKFNEIYNLAAQSFVDKSFISPVYTSNVNSLGVTRLLEAIRHYSKKTKLYQASSSEMFGNTLSKYQEEKTYFQPLSPYAISKLYSHWMLNLYREAYNLFCCSGILFNHDSPLRGKEFVAKKIVHDLAQVKFKIIPCLKVGNIYVRRDWGYAADYVEAMWKMLQHSRPDDYVISSGINHSIKSFISKVAKYYGFNIFWKGKGVNEQAIDKLTGKTIVKIDKKFFRPTEVNKTYGNPKKAKRILKWKPATGLDELVKIMCDEELGQYL
tara:strand:+ start:2161 stop:3180 length:1020 start_codon:yes stop_codon:yes gene_type:complete